MRILVFLLVLANLLFLAYTQGYFGRPENADAGRMAKQLNPESLRVVSHDQPPPETPRAPEPKPAESPADGAAKEGTTCTMWAALSSADADRLSALLAEKFDGFRQSRKTQAVEGGSWWVFIPPQANKADADKKAAELKKLGVADFFIIQDNGPNRWAISLGVFSAENGAKGRLADLRDKGVKSAKAAPRNTKDALQTLEARGPGAQQAAMLAAVAELLADAEAKHCP